MTQIILISFLGVLLLFGLRLLAQRLFLLGSVWLVSAILGLYFVLFPAQATLVANVLGVGRGTDLAFYLAACFMLVYVIATSARIRKIERNMTDLVREIAIANSISKQE